MSEYTSGIKFESRQAEQNINKFAEKVGKLAQNARTASTNVGSLAGTLDRAIRATSTAGVNMDRLAGGTLSFGKNADSAARAARGLIGALQPGKISETARALGSLQGKAGSAATQLRDASRAAGSLATQSGRAASAATRLHGALGSVTSSARSAKTQLAGAFGAIDTAKVANATRLMAALARNLNSGQNRMAKFSQDTNRQAGAFLRIGTSSTTATAGLNRVNNALTNVIPNMRMAANYAMQLQSNLNKIGGVPRISFPKPTGGGSLPGVGQSPNFNSYAQGARRASGEVKNLAGSLVDLRNIARYYIAGLGISELAKMADTVNLVRARISILTTDTAQQARAEKDLQSVTLRTRTNYDDNAKLFVKLGQAGKQYGVNLGQAMTVTENVAKALKISGASAAETSSTITQLSQAFASGKLQGDELRSVLENSPRLAQAFGEKLAYMGVNLSNIRQFAKEGKVGIQEMVKVLADESLTKELAEEFKRIPLTMADALTQTKNKLTFFIGELDKSLGITPKVVAVLQLAGNNLENIALAAGAVGVAMLASYVPGMVAATSASAAFIGLKLAEQGFAIRSGMAAAGTAAAQLGKNMTTLATGTGVARLAALPASISGIGTTFAAVSRVLIAGFFSWPVAIGLGIGALIAFKSEFRPIRTEMATTQDYLVTGFQMIYEAGVGSFGSMWSEIVKQSREDVNKIVALLDYTYRAIKAVRGAAADASTFGDRLKETAQAKVSGGRFGKDWTGNMTDGLAAKAWKTGIAEDFGGMVSGTEWNNRANTRAGARWARNIRNQNVVPYDQVRGTIAPSGKGDGKGDDDKKDRAGKSEAEKLRDELESLRTQIDPVEASRKKFNDGVDTLNKSMKAGYITAAEYKTLLGQLGTDTFKGLTDDIKKLNQENDVLAGKAKGITIDPRVLDARESVKTQVDALDSIIAKQGDSTGELKRQKEALTGQLATYEGLIKQNETLTKAAEARATKEKEIADLIENALNRTQEAFVNAVDGYITGAKSMIKSLLDLGRQTLSQYLGNALFSTVKEGLTRELKSLFNVKQDKIGSAAGNSTPGIVSTASGAAGVATTAVGAIKATLVDSSGKAENDNVPMENEISVTARSRRAPTFIESVREGYLGNMKGTGTTFANAAKTLGKAADKLGITDLGKKVADKLGINGQTIGRAVGRGLAGAQVGSATSDIAGMVGIKLNKTGSTIGGALGGAIGGPVGSIAGSVLGGVVGNLFAGPKANGSATVTGTGKATNVYGTSQQMKSGATGLAKNVQDGLNQLAEQLGAGVGAFKVSFGTYDGDYRVSSTGQTGELSYSKKNKQKGSLVDFKDDQAAAIAFAVQTAVKQGALTGLSETSTRILKSMQDTERAIVLATNIESVKSQAADIRSPGNSALKELQKNAKNLSDMFKEAGASASDWADLNTVLQQQYKDAVESSMASILAFRDSLKTGDLSYISPTAKLAAANDKFSDFEKKIASGDFNFKQEDFTNAGTTLSNTAREVYGSTPEFAQFQQRLIDATNKVVSNAQAEVDSYKPVVDAIAQQTQSQAQGQALTNQILQQMLAAQQAVAPAKALRAANF